MQPMMCAHKTTIDDGHQTHKRTQQKTQRSGLEQGKFTYFNSKKALFNLLKTILNHSPTQHPRFSHPLSSRSSFGEMHIRRHFRIRRDGWMLLQFRTDARISHTHPTYTHSMSRCQWWVDAHTQYRSLSSPFSPRVKADIFS